MELFHRIMMPQLRVDPAVDLYLIDEVAEIAPWSSQFITAMDNLLDSDRIVVAIVGLSPRHPYPNEVRERDDVDLWEVEDENRGQLLSDVLAWIDGEE
jgi:nucleoside-triphosphatase THEP1